MPGWVRPKHLDEPTGERGRIESFKFRSGTLVSSRGIPLEQEREIKVYLPPAYDEGEERYPLLVVNNGIQALQGDVPAAVEFGRVAAAPVNTLRQQPHRCQEISVCF